MPAPLNFGGIIMAKNKGENIEVKEEIVNEVENRIKEVTEAEIDNMAKESGKAINATEKVKVKIPLDPLNPKDEVVPVCVNGYFWYIKRGERVTVPKVVEEILENAGYI